MKTIKVKHRTAGTFKILLDEFNYYRALQRAWRIRWRDNRVECARTNFNGKTIPIHHFLFGKPPKGKMYDHISGNTLDNRRENLRLVTASQNSINKSKQRGKKLPKGVTKQGKRFRAVICAKGKTIHLGLYDNAKDAGYAYRAAARRYHGEFARVFTKG